MKQFLLLFFILVPPAFAATVLVTDTNGAHANLITGTPNGTQFLRDDFSWAAAVAEANAITNNETRNLTLLGGVNLNQAAVTNANLISGGDETGLELATIDRSENSVPALVLRGGNADSATPGDEAGSIELRPGTGTGDAVDGKFKVFGVSDFNSQEITSLGVPSAATSAARLQDVVNATNGTGGISAGVFTGNGAALTALNADNLASGTVADARIASTLTRDSEWDTIAEIETATGVNIILNTEIDTVSELTGILGDETTFGAAALQAMGTVVTNNMSVPWTNLATVVFSNASAASGIYAVWDGSKLIVTNPTAANLKVTITPNSMSVTSSAAAFMDYASSGSLKVYNDFTCTAGSIFTSAAGQIGWVGRSAMRSSADGRINLTEADLGGFSALQFGGTTAAEMSIFTTNTIGGGLEFKTASGSALTNITAAIINANLGFVSYATNFTANANTAGYTNSATAPGTGGSNTMYVVFTGVTSGSIEFYGRSGALGQTACGVGWWTNSALLGGSFPVGVNCGFVIRTGVGIAYQIIPSQ